MATESVTEDGVSEQNETKLRNVLEVLDVLFILAAVVAFIAGYSLEAAVLLLMSIRIVIGRPG